MKISEIHIKNFRQFEDLKLNLTYPKGHPKEGSALDKVCIIGQSGTGKTTLLKILRESTLAFLPDEAAFISKSIHKIDFGVDGIAHIHYGRQLWDNDVIHTLSKNGHERRYKEDLEKRKIPPLVANQLLYFPENLTNIQDFEKNQFTSEEGKSMAVMLFSLSHYFMYFEFNQDNATLLWNKHLYIIHKHRNKEANFRIALTKRAEKETVDIKSEMEKWRTENPNPLKKLADECLDKLLNRIHLATKTEIGSVEELNSIQIQLLKEEKTIPYEDLSTGTKQLLYTAFPLYYLLKQDTLVLMDQPENSLYPDMQMKIIPFYLSLIENKPSILQTQFFFATHSPIIASSFEPWEIVELKFNEKGKVYREKYHTGEGLHIDDYFLDPRYLKWDSILTKVFDLEEDSNNAFRSKKLMEFSILKNQLTKLKEEGKLQNPTTENQKIIEAYKKAGQLLDWSSLNGH